MRRYSGDLNLEVPMDDDDVFGFVPIVKSERTDDGTLIIEGIATDSSLDKSQQIADPEWLAKAMPTWFAEGGNVREQHDSRRAAGVATAYEKRDDGRHWIRAEIVDPTTVKKIERGVLRGFSFGATGARITTDKSAAGGRIVDGVITEVSVVDRPCNPGTRFTIAKADGAGILQPVREPELEEIEPVFTPSQLADLLKGLKGLDKGAVEKRDFSQGERDDAAAAGQAMPDGSYPIKTTEDLKNAVQAYGRASDKAAVKRHIVRRARALNAINLLPDDWNIAKADAVANDVRVLVGRDVTKAQDESEDIADAKDATAAIARLIISEAESLAAGNMAELYDIQILVNAAKSLQFFCDGEKLETETDMTTKSDATDQTAAATTSTEEEVVVPPADQDDTTSEKPAAETADTQETSDSSSEEQNDLSKSDLSQLLQDAITKATKPLQDELGFVKGELVKVLETPQTGGPVRTRTTNQRATAAKADTLRNEIDLCKAAIATTGGALQIGYRERLAVAEAELTKLDAI
jgi:hypothetical protein